MKERDTRERKERGERQQCEEGVTCCRFFFVLFFVFLGGVLFFSYFFLVYCVLSCALFVCLIDNSE